MDWRGRIWCWSMLYSRGGELVGRSCRRWEEIQTRSGSVLDHKTQPSRHGKGRLQTIIDDDIRGSTKMRIHFRKDLRYHSRIRQVGFDVQPPVPNNSVFDTASYRCYLVARASELVRDEAAGARTDTEDENSGLERHVGGEKGTESLSQVRKCEREADMKGSSV